LYCSAAVAKDVRGSLAASRLVFKWNQRLDLGDPGPAQRGEGRLQTRENGTIYAANLASKESAQA